MKRLLAALFFLLFVVPVSAQTCPTRPPGDNTNACATTAFVHAATGGTVPITVPNGGTGQTSFTANLPLIGNGSGALAQGTKSGNTTDFGTVTGTLTSGHCISIDTNGNLIDAGFACNSGSGSGTVSSASLNQLAVYTTNPTGPVVGGTFSPNFAATGAWYQPTANIQRWNDHMFVGGATVNDGLSPNGNQDWFSAFEVAAGSPSGATQFYEISALTEPSSAAASGAGGILGAAQSLNSTSAGTSTIGMFGAVVNNNTTLQTYAWGLYSEAHRMNSTVGQTNAIETEVRNLGNEVAVDPFSAIGAGNTTVAQEAGCGAGLSITGQHPCTAGIYIFKNPETFDSGIVFLNGSLNTLNAIQMPVNYEINWYSSAGVIAGTIGEDSSGYMNINTTTGLKISGFTSASCSSGINATTFRSVFGIVTHC